MVTAPRLCWITIVVLRNLRNHHGQKRPFRLHLTKPFSFLASNVITSTQSNTIKTLRDLLAKRKKRLELGETVAEGPRMIGDILRNPTTRDLVRQVIISEKKWEEYFPIIKDYQYNIRCILPASSQVLDSCTDTVTNQGIVARIRIPSYHPCIELPYPTPKYPLFLVIDGIQDPGNLGTLIRSSVATGVSGIFLLPGSSDVWNPKCLRSSMGAAFLLRSIRNCSSFLECIEVLETEFCCRRIFAASMLDDMPLSVPYTAIDWIQEPTALVIGSEGHGLREPVRSMLGRSIRNSSTTFHAVHVPMLGCVESLNAGVCGSILLFEYFRRTQCAGVHET